MENDYLAWLSSQTDTNWWADSGCPEDILSAIDHGAEGVTTNPILVNQALQRNKSVWKEELRKALSNSNVLTAAETLTGFVVQKAAEQLYTLYKKTNGSSGYVCAQVNPGKAHDREYMYDSALKMAAFAENISVKLPATAAGFDVMEACIEMGINITTTVSFSLSQVLETGRRYRSAKRKAESAGRQPGRCNAVIMVGRIDDYIRDAVQDVGVAVNEEDIQYAGLSIVKKAYSIYKNEGYENTLMVAAMRGTYHITELAGADMILSIHPKYQVLMDKSKILKTGGIEHEISKPTLRKLLKVPEYVKAYEPDGMAVSDFYSFGAVQRTLTQFTESGWDMLEKCEW